MVHWLAHGRSSFYCLACVLACNIYTNTDKFKQSSHNVMLSCFDAHLVHLSTDLVLFEGLEAFLKVRTVSCVAYGLVCIAPAQSWFWHADTCQCAALIPHAIPSPLSCPAFPPLLHPNTSPSLDSLLLHYMHAPAVTSLWIMQVIQCRLDHQKCTHAHEHAALDMHVLYIIINLSSFSLFNLFFPSSLLT